MTTTITKEADSIKITEEFSRLIPKGEIEAEKANLLERIKELDNMLLLLK